MPTEVQNLNKWSSDYNWSQLGDEWSEAWGGTDNLFWWMLYPRTRKFLNVERILEIAPGHGRITQFLKDSCKELIIVDISQNCINSCKQRFKTSENIIYYVNDGKSLDMINEESIDFVFSFDSLVHCEKNVIKNYLYQLSKKLSTNGKGFIHHSNLGNFFNFGERLIRLFPPDIVNNHWRAKSMTAKLFRSYCNDVNLNCYSQELINWGGKYLIDCFSVFEKTNSLKTKNTLIKNTEFMNEANYIKNISQLYK